MSSFLWTCKFGCGVLILCVWNQGLNMIDFCDFRIKKMILFPEYHGILLGLLPWTVGVNNVYETVVVYLWCVGLFLALIGKIYSTIVPFFWHWVCGLALHQHLPLGTKIQLVYLYLLKTKDYFGVKYSMVIL